MNIYSLPGTKVIYTGEVSDSQVRWGIHDDPRGVLTPGKEYIVEKTEVRSYHTKVYLKDFPGWKFNSVWFKEVNDG